MNYDLFTYPHAAGAKEPTTSRDAAEAIEGSGRAAVLRARVLEIFAWGYSTTADGVADVLGESPFSVRPRVSELYKQGKIERTGHRHVSDNGRPSHVYRLAKVTA